jgi:hypothetical protein
MRNKILTAGVAAFVLAFGGSALAAPPFDQVKKDDETKNPAAADAALSKTEAKDAKKNAHIAQKKAKAAEHKEKDAAKDAGKAAADTGAAH